MKEHFILLSGTANPELAAAIGQEIGVPLGACTLERFPDGEVSVRLEESVRRREVFIIQPTSPPVDAHLVELLALADACRRAAAARITALVPYFGYARADQRHGRREPITASMVAGLMQAVGIQHVITLDLHALQIEGFFHIPVDSLTAVPRFCEVLHRELSPDTVIVSPDAGRVGMATDYAHRLNTAVVVLQKRRESGSETAVTRIIGDVRDRTCLIVDDMITTGGTMAESIAALLQAGARPEITIAATHGLLLQGARRRLTHPAVRDVWITDSVPVREPGEPPVRVVSIAPLLAEAIGQILSNGSLSQRV